MSATTVTPTVQQERAPAGIVASVTAEWRFKLMLYAGLSLFFCVPYFTIQRIEWIRPHTLALTALDRMMGYHPAAIYLYQSAYLLIPLLPILSVNKEELRRFARGFVLMCCISFAVFLVFPVAGPRPAGIAPNPMAQLVYSYDRNLNAFPSLHVALATYSVLYGYQRREAWLKFACTVWLVGIIYSTVATKQHYVIDLPPGLLLAWGARRWAWKKV